jgi:hypothetical protein
VAGRVRFFLEIAHQSGKRFDLWANFYPRMTDFLHIWCFPEPEKATNLGIFGRFRIGRGLAITQKYQDIVRDRQGASA